MAANFGGDFEGSSGVTGYISGVSKEVETPYYIGSVLNYTHSRLAPAFDQYLDALARSAPESFHHVYEWPKVYGNKNETIGVPQWRLWKQFLRGGGRSRTASFDFRTSKRAVPVNPILTKPGPSGNAVKRGVHVFYWKAPLMEYGAQITVRPKIAKSLAFVGKQGNIVFTQNPVTFTAGGGKSTGKFTGAFSSWWSSMASDIFDKEVAPTLARDLVDEAALGRLSRRVGTTRAKSMSIAASNRSFTQAREEAIMRLKNKAKDYESAARARRAFIYGD